MQSLYLFSRTSVGRRLCRISFGGSPDAHGARCYLRRQLLHRFEGEYRALDWPSKF